MGRRKARDGEKSHVEEASEGRERERDATSLELCDNVRERERESVSVLQIVRPSSLTDALAAGKRGREDFSPRREKNEFWRERRPREILPSGWTGCLLEVAISFARISEGSF